MARTFYAFAHRYGQTTGDSRGRSIGVVYGFTTRAARDRWVSRGPAYSTAPGFREAVSASSREVRSATRADYWDVSDGDAELAAADALDQEAEAWAEEHRREQALRWA